LEFAYFFQILTETASKILIKIALLFGRASSRTDPQ